MIDPRLDLLVWGAVLLLLVLMGMRAWAVETTAARHYRKSARVRLLNGATALALVGLVGLMAMQGGVLLVQAIVTRTDPETFVTVIGDDSNADQAVADPDDQPDQPGAPADPNAPAGPGGAAPDNPGPDNLGPGAPPAQGGPAGAAPAGP
ncbi:hypothetical protein [Pseudonocardia sp. DLS-67]